MYSVNFFSNNDDAQPEPECVPFITEFWRMAMVGPLLIAAWMFYEHIPLILQMFRDNNEREYRLRQ